MKNLLLTTLLLLVTASTALAVDYTPNYNLSKPEDNYTTPTPSWGSLYRSNMDAVDTAIAAAAASASAKVPLAGGTMTGNLTMAANILASGAGRTIGADATPFAAVYATALYAKGMTTAGVVKNSAAGLLSGGNTVDVSSDTNLSVAAPITLTGDQIGWNGTTTNVPEGTNLYYTQARFDARAAALIQDSPEVDFVYVANTSLKANLILGAINHNSLLNAGGNQHIDWTNASSNLYTSGTLRGSGATLAGMTVAGFVKNSAAGVLSGGQSIDISGDTNLTSASPIVMSGDQITWAGTTANVPENVANLYYTQARVDARAAALIQDSPEVDFVYVTNTSLKANLILGAINHNSLLNAGGNQHIDWTNATSVLSSSASSAANGAVRGTNTNTSGLSSGLRGMATGVTSTSYTFGVHGSTVSTADFAAGIRGEAPYATGVGVWGTGLKGIYGYSQNSGGSGVYGTSFHSAGYGGYFDNTSTGYALYSAKKSYLYSSAFGSALFSPDYPVDSLNTAGPQLNLRRDAAGSVYARFTVDSIGALYLITSGTTVDMEQDTVRVGSLQSAGSIAGTGVSASVTMTSPSFVEAGTALTSKYSQLGHTHTGAQVTDLSTTAMASYAGTTRYEVLGSGTRPNDGPWVWEGNRYAHKGLGADWVFVPSGAGWINVFKISSAKPGRYIVHFTQWQDNGTGVPYSYITTGAFQVTKDFPVGGQYTGQHLRFLSTHYSTNLGLKFMYGGLDVASPGDGTYYRTFTGPQDIVVASARSASGHQNVLAYKVEFIPDNGYTRADGEPVIPATY